MNGKEKKLAAAAAAAAVEEEEVQRESEKVEANEEERKRKIRTDSERMRELSTCIDGNYLSNVRVCVCVREKEERPIESRIERER